MFRSCAIKNVPIQRKFCDMVSSSKLSNSHASSATIEMTDAKSFDAIPGPKGLFGMGTLMQYSPLIGKNRLLE